MDLEGALRGLIDDRTHGASELARTALEIAARWSREQPAQDLAEFLAALSPFAGKLATSRPCMAPIANLVGAWERTVHEHAPRSLAEARDLAAQAARSEIERSLAATRKAAGHAAALVPEGAIILTHSLSSTIVEIFRQLRGRSVHPIVTESRPGLEGHKLALQLAEWEFEVTLITDAAAGLSAGQADLVVTGADTIRPDGSLVNKTGTLLLALAAREYGKPFYICAESFKRQAASSELELESKDPLELGAPTHPGIHPANIYFDHTPAPLITAWIAEEGPVPEPNHRGTS